jgi:Lar family restriction alleviation protein
MTEQEQVQLLPCPFCGGKADILSAAGNICDYWITCANCGADGSCEDTRAETIAAWNTRHTATAEALEAMREAREALRKIDRMNDHPAWFRKTLNDIVEPTLTCLTTAIAETEGQQP